MKKMIFIFMIGLLVATQTCAADEIYISGSGSVLVGDTPPSNQEIIKQRKEQDTFSRELEDSEILEEYPDGIILTISGVKRDQADELADLLKRHIGYIDEIKVIEEDRSFAVFSVKLFRMEIHQFSQIFNDYQISGYTLDLIRVEDEKIDLILK